MKLSPTKLKNPEKQEDDGEKQDAVMESEKNAADEVKVETEEEKQEQKKKQEEEMMEYENLRDDGKQNPVAHVQLESMTKQPDAGYADILLNDEGGDPTYMGYDSAANKAHYDSSSIHDYAVATHYHDNDNTVTYRYDKGRVDHDDEYYYHYYGNGLQTASAHGSVAGVSLAVLDDVYNTGNNVSSDEHQYASISAGTVTNYFSEVVSNTVVPAAAIAMNDDGNKDLCLNKGLLRHLESRDEYCANICTFDRPEVQTDGYQFKKLISDCVYSSGDGCPARVP